MVFRLRQIEAERKVIGSVRLESLERAIPAASVRGTLQELGLRTRRIRKLSLEMIVWVVIGMNLWTHASMEYVLQKMLWGLRLLWPGSDFTPAGESAIAYRREQLGARPMALLFRRLCRPMATMATRGAFQFGLRLMGIDGHREEVPDTPENARCFGRPKSGRGEAAYPQVQAAYLFEIGTHAVVDAGFWPISVSEEVGAYRLLRSVVAGMLLMLDRGLYSFDMVRAIVRRGAHVLARMPKQVKPQYVRLLPDGSWLAFISPAERKRKNRGERLLVRIIAYTLSDPGQPGHKKTYRLVTTLLDTNQAPAFEVAQAYHERWDVEGTIDEMDTHQHLADGPLRSRKPVGVIQELYGLLIAHYAVRCLMHEAAIRAGVDPDQISYTHTLRLIQDRTHDFQIAAEELRPGLLRQMVQDIAEHLLPPRRLRSNPRVVKRKMSNFPLKRSQHDRPATKQPTRQSLALI